MQTVVIQKDNKLMESIAASIILNQMALHYNEEIKHTRFYKQTLKNRLNGAITELQKAEQKEFDLVDMAEEEITHQISSNIITYIEFMIKGGFTNFMMLANMQYAYDKNPKAIEGIVNKVLNN